MMEGETKPTILVTGFGPFGNYKTNPSWSAVELLPKLFSSWEKSDEFNLVIEEIPVIYQYVSDKIKELWIKHKPLVILNVGVSHKANCLTLENQANAKGYSRKDILNECPIENVEANITLKTKCKLPKLCQLINENCADETGCKACISEDAGGFLCEYIYYHSLSLEAPLSLFVHIPQINVYSSEKTANGLLKILIHLIESALDNKNI